ncbi:MAG: hypothetical protein KME67_03980 [Candidatus Thiodiazotropha sp. (ex Codakia orbicularis)]|nr:hypothetical protein [Candidatus Thiodiazotropha sp. (ex Codakia orbicularis)]
MKRIDDCPAAAGALCDIRSNLDDSPDKYSRHWAGMPAQRKLMHLRREGMGDDLRPWDQYSSDEKFLIRRSLKRVMSTAIADARMMGAIE